ncbi:MAG: F0F1 ATP synthase subunit epsilon, partial [Planctomycetaceae bacterium]
TADCRLPTADCRLPTADCRLTSDLCLPPMPADHLRLVLVTPEKTLLDEPVRSLRAPLYDGSAGFYPGRAPLIGRLGYGELRLNDAAGGSRSYFVDGGFVQVKGNVVSVLTNRAVPADDLKTADAEELLREANDRRAVTAEEFAAKARDQQRARRMAALARR